MKKKDTARTTVVSVRLDEESIGVLDLLVNSGLVQSRSEAAAHLVGLGIQSAGEMLSRAKKLAEEMQKFRREMMEAVKTKDTGLIRQLLNQDASLVNGDPESGDTPLLMSIYYGAPEVSHLLLERGANLNMFEAISMGQLERVKELLKEQGADVNAYSHDGWTMLHLAAHFGQSEAIRFLVEAGAELKPVSKNFNENTPLHAALAGRREEAAKLLIGLYGEEVSIPDSQGWTPLHLAAANGLKESVELLLARGADVNSKNKAEKTPLDLAKEYGHGEIAELLTSASPTA